MKSTATRKEAKEVTRRRVLAAAKQEVIRIGVLRLSTVDVARRAKVAHGTVFFHFPDRDALLTEVLDGMLLALTDELRRLLETADGFAGMLDVYLNYLEREEPFYATLAREMPLFPPPLRRLVQGREAAVRHYFLRALEADIERGAFREVDTISALNFLFGTLHYYLCFRDSFASGGSVIREKRESICGTFLKFLAK